MKLDSKYFDSIRIRPREKQKTRERHPRCQRRGCTEPAPYKAPKGRGHEGEFYRFCLDHVREYNKKYNYFDGMSDDEIVQYQHSASTQHRPTWQVGANAWAHDLGASAAKPNGEPAGYNARFTAFDAHEFFAEQTGQQAGTTAPRRPLRRLERRSLRVLNLDDNATGGQIKTRYKELVKQHHPDANGGDRGSEEKLREVIQAYNYLKQEGLC